jgi:hypothetical protein
LHYFVHRRCWQLLPTLCVLSETQWSVDWKPAGTDEGVGSQECSW